MANVEGRRARRCDLCRAVWRVFYKLVGIWLALMLVGISAAY